MNLKYKLSFVVWIVLIVSPLVVYRQLPDNVKTVTELHKKPEEQKFSDLQIKKRMSLQNDIEMSRLHESLPFDNQPGGVWKQGFPINYSMSDWNEHRLEVIILPHSHQDPGWLQTTQEYFDKMSHHCLDEAVDFLADRPNVRFIFAEVAFLDLWWQSLSPSKKNQFKKLVQRGQWEIATGGWVVNDEATTHYDQTISQLTEGHQWLLDNLDYSPNTSWAIDPFGHSTTNAYLLNKAGIKNILINRVHYEVKKELARQRKLEFNWRQSWDTTGNSEVFTHMLPFYSYDVPHTCGPNPAICCQFDFARVKSSCPWGIPPTTISDSNIQERASVLADQYRQKAKLFDNNDVLLVPLGDDFRLLNQEEWNLQVSNYQRLMDHINADPTYKMHIQFGTLSEYFNLVHSRKPRQQFSTLRGDFFTYADRDHDYWSGYFTSRPALKAASRHLANCLRTAEILFSLAHHWSVPTELSLDQGVLERLYETLTIARRGQAQLQHHDAITGTAKVRVVQDFEVKLEKALQSAQIVSAASAAYLLGHQSKEVVGAIKNQILQGFPPVLVSSSSPLWGAEATQIRFNTSFNGMEGKRQFHLFNSLPCTRDHTFSVNVDLTGLWQELQKLKTGPHLVRLEVNLDVDSDDGSSHSSEIPSQLEVAPFQISTDVLLFRLTAGPIRLAPLQMVRITVSPKTSTSGTLQTGLLVSKPILYKFQNLASSMRPFYTHEENTSLVEPTLESSYLGLQLDRNSGFSKVLHNKMSGKSYRLNIHFDVVRSDPTPGMAGAYLSAPINSPRPLYNQASSEGAVKRRFLRGPVLEESTTYYPQVEHTLRLYKAGTPGQFALEVENVVDLSKGNNDNSELVMTLDTDVNNTDRLFYTDSNCFQMIRRKSLSKLPLQGNIYPMTCAVYIEDQHTRVTVLSAQPHGVTAGSQPGQVRIWLDRRINNDDKRGLFEAMSDSKPSRSLFRVLVEEKEAVKEEEELLVVSHTQQHQTPSSASLSKEAHHVLNDLNHPVAQFSNAADPLSSRLVADRPLMSPAGLGCDHDLVTMKTFFSRSDRYRDLASIPGSQLGLVLHRHRPACCFKSLCPGEKVKGDTFVCSQTPCRTQPKITELFPNLVVKGALKTPVNLIPSRTTRRSSAREEVSVEPMEVEAFLLVPDGFP